MAGRLLRENRWIEGAVGQGSAQAQAAAAVMLSGGDREVTVVCVRARPALLSCEVQTDGVAVQGTVEFAALYLTEEGALRQRGAQAGFTAVIPVPGAGPKMRARVLVTAAEETAREERILDLQQSAADALARSDRRRAHELQNEIVKAQARAMEEADGGDEVQDAREEANESQANAEKAESEQ